MFTTNSQVNLTYFFDNFESKVLVNPHPSFVPPLQSAAVQTSDNLFVISCLESGEDYQLDIGIQGLPIRNLNGNNK